MSAQSWIIVVILLVANVTLIVSEVIRYSPDYSMKLIYDAIMKYEIDAEAAALLKDGHEEIQKTECYDNYGVPSYIR